jgi:hypothetical protein
MPHQKRQNKNEVQKLEDTYRISKASQELAERISRRYTRGLFNSQLSKVPYQLDNDLDLQDLVKNLGILSTLMQQLESISYKDDIPCLVIGTSKVPINAAIYIANPDQLPEVLNPTEIMRSPPPFQLTNLVRNIKRASNSGFTTVSRQALEQSMTSDVKEFILVRYASTDNEEVKQSMLNHLATGGLPGSGGGPGYLTVDLTTTTASLDIDSSPAYFINWEYFGSPSKHVVGQLKPGKFVFSGTGASLSARKVSSHKVSIPPNFNITVNDI